MAVSNIPEILNGFNAYLSGSKLIGITDEVTLPDFEAMSETISGAGIAGEYEAANPGYFGSMEQEIPFRLLYGDIFSLMDPSAPVELTLRGSEQISDGTGAKKNVGVRVILRGNPKKMTGGTLKAGSPMEPSVTIELTYIKIEVAGKTEIELDKLNSIYIVHGNDVMAAIRDLC